MNSTFSGIARCRYKRFFAVAVAMLVLCGAQVQADILTWTGGNSANWNDAGNWNTGNAPINGDSLIFGAAGTSGTTLANNFSSGLSVAGITFNADAPSYTIASVWTKLTGDIVNNSANAQIINLGHELSSSVAFNAAAGDINILANNSVNVNGQTLTVKGIHNTTINIKISGNDSTNLIKEDTGTLTLGVNNPYSGAITINGGTLIAKVGGSLGPDSNARTIAVNQGATLQFNAHDMFGQAGANPAITINVNGGTLASNNSFTTFGPLNLNGGTLVDNGGANTTYRAFQLKGDVTVGGNVASIIKDGGTGTNRGVQLSANGTTTFNVADATSDSNADLIISANLYNGPGASSSLIKTGAGTMSLEAANEFTGNVTINGGTLIAKAGRSLGPDSNARTIDVNEGATLQFNVHDTFGGADVNPTITINVNGGTLASSNTFTTFGPLNLNGGTLVDNGGANDNYRAFQLKGDVTVGGNVASIIKEGGTGNYHGVQLSENAAAAFTTTFNVADATGDSNADLIISAKVYNGPKITGSSLVKTGAGTMSLEAANEFTGNVTINGGTLISGAIGSLGPDSNARTIDVNEGATLQFNVHDTFGGADVNPTLAINVNGGTLASNNTFTTFGPLNLNGGTLVDNGGANDNYRAFQLKGDVTVGGNVASIIKEGGTGAFRGVQLSENAAAAFTTTFNVADATGDSNADLIISAKLYNGPKITGSSLVKTGVGTMSLEAANAFTGVTTVSDGTLNLTAENAIAGSSAVVNNATINATANQEIHNLSGTESDGYLSMGDMELEMVSDVDSLYAGRISSTGTVTKSGSGVFTMNYASTGIEDPALAAETFIIDAGRANINGLVASTLRIGTGAEFSPGEEVGVSYINALDVMREGDEFGKLIFEYLGEEDAGGWDQLSFFGTDTQLTLNDGVIFLEGDWDTTKEYLLVTDIDLSANGDMTNYLSTPAQVNWFLQGTVDGALLVGRATGPEVPEPSTAILLLLGTFGLAMWRRRK